jgi:hypothetical protein
MSGTTDFADFLTFIVFVEIMTLNPHVRSHTLVQLFFGNLAVFEVFCIVLSLKLE